MTANRNAALLGLIWMMVFFMTGVFIGWWIKPEPAQPQPVQVEITYPTEFVARVERLEEIVGLRGREARPEGLQNRISRGKP